jgi:hypothetical protein
MLLLASLLGAIELDDCYDLTRACQSLMLHTPVIGSLSSFIWAVEKFNLGHFSVTLEPVCSCKFSTLFCLRTTRVLRISAAFSRCSAPTTPRKVSLLYVISMMFVVA